MMDMLELVKRRRSIRKYKRQQIGISDLEKIIEAGLYAPNAGGRQSPYIAAIRNEEILLRLGRLNMAALDRSKLSGMHVSSEQPSIIDNPDIKNAFYNAPTVCAIFAPDDFPYGIPDAYCCAESMLLTATSLDISSCIIARGKETFSATEGKQYLAEFGVPDGYSGCCFVALGYCDGDYPREKPRKSGRYKIIE